MINSLVKRSDINNINKLFVESVSDDAYVIYSTSLEDNETLPASGETLEDATLNALAQYFDERPPELYETLKGLSDNNLICVDTAADMSIIWMFSVMIVARPSAGVTNDSIIKIAKACRMSSSSTISRFAVKMEHENRKAKALYGSNDEAGLGSVLDVL